MIETIKKAIADQAPVLFIYKETPRYVLPFLLGKSREGKLVLHGWQVKQDQSEDETGGWRFFYLEKTFKLQAAVAVPLDRQVWDEPLATIKKSEGDYKPPAFIAEVLAVRS